MTRRLTTKKITDLIRAWASGFKYWCGDTMEDEEGIDAERDQVIKWIGGCWLTPRVG